ncbi:MAG: hypothetical protein JSW05_01200 [Candidatus Thorarchaeota archaeon]|nr:MAG: hypothetical protein JSW05_01200 [Candidatus Thorarchaeota archaeon]
MDGFVRSRAIIGPFILMVAGILPFINGISAWTAIGPDMLGCWYDHCIPTTILPFALQMLFGTFAVALGYNILKVGRWGEDIPAIALSLGVIELLMVVASSLYLSQWDEWAIPIPFYLMIWFSAILVMVGAVIVSAFRKED